jgi:hypothetical protein
MRGAGVEHASRATSKTRRKDASTEQPKNKWRCWLSVKSAMKEDWVKSHPRLWLVDAHNKNLPSIPESAFLWSLYESLRQRSGLLRMIDLSIFAAWSCTFLIFLDAKLARRRMSRKQQGRFDISRLLKLPENDR